MDGEQVWKENKCGRGTRVVFKNGYTLICTTGMDLNKRGLEGRGLEPSVDLNKAWTSTVAQILHSCATAKASFQHLPFSNSWRIHPTNVTTLKRPEVQTSGHLKP